MKYIPDDKPRRCYYHHGECEGTAFQDILHPFLYLSPQQKSIDAI